MKLKVYTKRTLSLILCVVMLLSCWVFTAPGAGAADASEYAYRSEHQDANPVYHVEIDLHVLDAGNGFDRVFKGTQTGNPDGWAWDAKDYKDMGGIVIWYKDNNGTAASEKDYSIDFSPSNTKTAYYHSDGSQVANNTMFPTSSSSSRDNWDDKYYTLCLDLSGFPTAYAVYNNNDNMKGNFITGYKPDTWTDFEITQIRVSGYDSSVDVTSEAYDSYRPIFTGNIRSASTDGENCSRYYIQQDGTVSIWRPNEFGSNFEDNTENNWVHFSDFAAGQDAMKKGGSFNSAYSKSWEMPYPYLPDYNYTRLSDEKNYYPAPEHAELTEPYTFGKDQYGAQLAGTVTSSFVCLGEKYYDGSAWQNASFSDPSYFFNNQTAEITPLKANGYQYHQFDIRPQTEWVIGGQYINVNDATNGMYYGNTKTVLMNYAPQTVTYTYNTTTTLAAPVETDTENHIYDSMGTAGTAQAGTASALYGDTITAAAPTGTYNYYDASGHYAANDPAFTAPTAAMTADVGVPCNYGETTAHEWGAWQNFTGETEGMAAAAYHRSVCTAVAGEPHYRYQPHNWVRTTGEKIATGQALNHVVYQCADCELFAAASYDPIQGYSVDTTHTGTAVSDVQADSATIATPVFNVKEDTSIHYQYALRLASLRVKQEEIASTTQALRFSGNLNVQNLTDKGVSLHVNPAQVVSGGKIKSLESIQNDAAIQDTIVDFGFIFTQARMINTQEGLDLDALTLEGTQAQNPSVFKMSVVENNAAKPAFDNNWKGATLENQDLTFNLVVAISRNNWKATYVARTYVVYKYHGDMFVLYDSPETVQGAVRYSHDSVYNQTQKNLALSNTPQSIKDYLNTKIVSYCDSSSFSGYSDWNTAYLPKG